MDWKLELVAVPVSDVMTVLGIGVSGWRVSLGASARPVGPRLTGRVNGPTSGRRDRPRPQLT